MNDETEKFGGNAFILTADLVSIPGKDKFNEHKCFL